MLQTNKVQAFFQSGRDEAALGRLASGMSITVDCNIKGGVLLNVLADGCTSNHWAPLNEEEARNAGLFTNPNGENH